MHDFLNLRQLARNKEYEQQLQVQWQKYTLLESKLEKIRNLIADGEIQKLKRMLKEGKI